jgi:hypothetical protein
LEEAWNAESGRDEDDAEGWGWSDEEVLLQRHKAEYSAVTENNQCCGLRDLRSGIPQGVFLTDLEKRGPTYFALPGHLCRRLVPPGRSSTMISPATDRMMDRMIGTEVSSRRLLRRL